MNISPTLLMEPNIITVNIRGFNKNDEIYVVGESDSKININLLKNTIIANKNNFATLVINNDNKYKFIELHRDSKIIRKDIYTYKREIKIENIEILTDAIVKYLFYKSLKLDIVILYLKKYLLFQDINFSIESMRYIGESFMNTGYSHLLAKIASHFLPKKIKESEGYNYSICFDSICDGFGWDLRAEELCLKDIAINGSTFWSLQNLGHCSYMKDNKEAQDNNYIGAKNRLFRLGIANAHYNNPVFQWLPHDKCEMINKNQDIDTTLDIEYDHFNIPNNIENVHLVACDDIYFNKYGRTLINSSARMGASLIHIHVDKPSDTTINELSLWSNNKNANVRYSISNSKYNTKGYYTCLRYFIAPEILKKYNKPILITDIDCSIIKSWKEAMAYWDGYDISYYHNACYEKHITNLKRIGISPFSLFAGGIFIRNNFKGLKFLKFVNDYISHALNYSSPEKWYEDWGVDQLALCMAIDYVAIPLNMRACNMCNFNFIGLPLYTQGMTKSDFVQSSKALGPLDFKLT